MDKFVIVIGRQYGAGGRKLGHLLAEKLNVKYYDRNLLSEAASELGMSRELLDSADEKRPSFIRSLLSFNYGSSSAAFYEGTISDESIYGAQSKVIRKICERESCVIVGRTADYVMRDHPGLMSVFVHAPEETRAANMVANNEFKSHKEARDEARKRDKARESYYNYYTNRRWGSAANYDLTFDSSKIDIETIAELIMSKVRNSDSK